MRDRHWNNFPAYKIFIDIKDIVLDYYSLDSLLGNTYRIEIEIGSKRLIAWKAALVTCRKVYIILHTIFFSWLSDVSESELYTLLLFWKSHQGIEHMPFSFRLAPFGFIFYNSPLKVSEQHTSALFLVIANLITSRMASIWSFFRSTYLSIKYSVNLFFTLFSL